MVKKVIFDDQFDNEKGVFEEQLPVDLSPSVTALSMSWKVNATTQDIKITVNPHTKSIHWHIKPCLPLWVKKNSENYANFCGACGRKLRVGEGEYRWDGLFVCGYDMELKHPQDDIRAIHYGKQEGQTAKHPESEDYFLGLNEVTPDDL